MSSFLVPTCKICERVLDDDESFSVCVQQHVTCNRCGTASTVGPEGPIKISANDCRVCHRKIIDPAGEVSGFPPKIQKAFLLQKLISDVFSVCEVKAHARKCIAKFFCSDCTVYCCEECIPLHIRDSSESPKHTICSLEKKVYKKESPGCTECKDGDAKCYCENQTCNALLCGRCLKLHDGHDVIPIGMASSAMTAFLEQSGKHVRDSYDNIGFETDGLDIERRARISEYELLEDKIREWAASLRAKVDRDEQALLEEVGSKMEATEEKYEWLNGRMVEDATALAYFEMIHDKLEQCRNSEDKLIDMFTFVRANEQIVNGGCASVSKNGSGSIHCEKFEFKFNEEVETVLTAMGQESNLIGQVKSCGQPRLVTSLSSRCDSDKHSQRLSGITLLPNQRRVAVMDSGNRKIKLVSGKESVVAFNADVEDNDQEDGEIQNGFQNGRHGNGSGNGNGKLDIIYDERKNTVIMNRKSRGQIIELTLEGKLFRVLRKIEDAVSLCICKNNLLVGREISADETTEGAIDTFDRITWTFLESKHMPFVPHTLKATFGGNIVSSDMRNGSVYILTQELQIMACIQGAVDGVRMSKPTGLCVTNRNHILVSDSANNRILEYSSGGKYLRTLLKDVDGLRKPTNLTCDEKGNLFVLDAANIVKVFSHV
ncbi:uncharacterized protein LOC135493875 isoform X2 [Lineus longissimus]